MNPPLSAPQYPFRDPQRQPDWAQLTRWGGDRVAVLFEDLRKRIGKIEGLVEDLHYSGAEDGWTPRYRVGGDTLFIAHVAPGKLEVTLALDAARWEQLRSSRKAGRRMTQTLSAARLEEGKVSLRLPLSNRAAVRSFSALVVLAGKLLSASGPS